MRHSHLYQSVILLLCIMLTLFPIRAIAGDLDSPAAPSSGDSAMYTLEDVYNRVNDGTAGTKRSGAFTEPSAGPASTDHTMDQLYDLASERSRPAKTGQTTSCRTHDDGDLEKGVTWPSTRFTDNSDGTVTDNLTGLIWLKNANCAGTTKTWNDAVDWAAALYDGCSDCGGDENDCGLSDSSSAGDWRLPNVNELHSLLDYGRYNPSLPSGQPFSGVQSNVYWSSTTYANGTVYAWSVYLYYGSVSYPNKTGYYYVWPVRGGQ